MILSVEITEKSFGNKQLLQNIKFSIDEGEKVGLIGRNGIGKSTLFSILLGRDQDFSGEVIFRKGSVIVSTQQEYSSVGEQTVLDFILNDLPEYAHLSKLLRELPEKMGENMALIEKYTDALNRFQEKNFHFIEDKIKAEPLLYKESIEKLQEIIRTLVDKGVEVETLERRNQIKFDINVSKSKDRIRSYNLNSNAVTKYYSNMSGNIGEGTYFVDKKK